MLIAKVSPVQRRASGNANTARMAKLLLAIGITSVTQGWMVNDSLAAAQTPDNGAGTQSTASSPATATGPSESNTQDSARARALAIAQAKVAAQEASAAQSKGKKSKQSKPAIQAAPIPQPTAAMPVPTATPASQTIPAMPAPQAAPVAQVKQSKQAKTPKPIKESKNVYTGPNTLEVLPQKPMLDEEGKQRVDPDGNLMFYPVVQQVRDKKGHPVFDRSGQPVFQSAKNMGYDDRGKKIDVKKEKEPKRTPVSIRAATLTVDGWTNKAGINFNIPDLKYLYVYVPGLGTTIVSPGPFPGATVQAGAFKDNALRVTVEGHPIELTSDRTLLGRGAQKAWVSVDREFVLPTKYPTIGFGMTTVAPYVWPGSKQAGVEAGVNMKKLPFLPRDMVAAPLSPCPTGMIRRSGPPAKAGQIEVEQPCVSIQTKPAATEGEAAASSNVETARATESNAQAAATTTSSTETSSAISAQPPK